jgi:integrase
LNREITRHGKPVWYVRIGKGPRIRLRAAYGTPEFDAEYRAAVDGRPLQASTKATVGTLQWLYERYRETGKWTSLSIATRRQRENIFAAVMAKSGAEKAAVINRASIVKARDARSATPFQARHFMDSMRGLFRWALEAGHVKVDPTAGVANLPKPKTEGFPAWTEDDVAAYERRWPIGTKERVWLDVLLYTGLRRGDAVRIGRQHVRDGIATLTTAKTGEVVTIPILPVLKHCLNTGPCGDLAFICGERGQPLTKESFGNLFSDACRAAGLKGKSAHGVRKIGATRAADNGATVAQLNAIFGWRGSAMASLYTQKADRARLARDAMAKLARTIDEQISPAPKGKVRAGRQKA